MSDPTEHPFHAHYKPSAPPTDPDGYLRSCVEVDATDMRAEYSRVSSDLAFWSAQYAKAYSRFVQGKILLDRARASAYLVERETCEEMGKKATEASIDARVRLDSQVQDAEAELIEADYERERLRGVVDAIRAKKDMLVSIGATVRAEWAADPGMMRGAPPDGVSPHE